MAIEKIRKRNGTIVDFDRTRIERAIHRACVDVQVNMEPAKLVSITDNVLSETENLFKEATPDVESIQDTVERTLAENGFFDVAKAYIVYRKEHEKIRERLQQEMVQKIETTGGQGISLKKQDGTQTDFDIQILRDSLAKFAVNYDSAIDQEMILNDVKRAVFDGMTTQELTTALVMSCRAYTERDPQYSLLAAQVLFNDLYRTLLGIRDYDPSFVGDYKLSLKDSIQRGIDADRIDPQLLEFDFGQLTAVIDPARDRLFHYMGAQTLYDRYFIRNYDKDILELPQHFWMRIAMGLALDEEKSMRTKMAIEFYQILSQLRYVPSTPTLFHSGTTHPQMSSCFLTTVTDDLHHIFKCIGDNAQLSKWAGGVANDWTNIRATGALIKTTNVHSQGVVPFLKIADSTTGAINRSARRRGATVVYLETWHYDMELFLNLRKNTGDERQRTHDMNTANWIPDLFMKRVLNDEQWTLFSPDETPELHHIYGKEFEERYEAYEQEAKNGNIRLFKQVRAKDMWRKMITMIFETGHPWITFKDPSNIRSPQDHMGVVHSSNLCTEITLNTSKDETAVCNLGSVNIPKHVVNGKIDGQMLAHTVKLAMRMLDNVINQNFYATPEAKNSNLKHRPVGLGIMGVQDALYKLGHEFGSEDAVTFSDEIMEYITYNGILASSELAKERGTYESYKGSKWDRGIFPIDTIDLLEKERGMDIDVDRTERMDWTPVREHVAKHGMRNSNCFAIAPTATIANISGVLPSIEPIYKNLYTKSNIVGEFTVVNQSLIEDLKQHGLWSPEMLDKMKYYDGSIQEIDEIPETLKNKYKEVFEINPIWLIKHAAVRGKWIDQSQSLNIFTSSTSGRVLSDIYFAAWNSGVKTTYYLRTLGATSIEKSTIDINKKFASQPEASAPAAIVEPQISAEVVTATVTEEVQVAANGNVISASSNEVTTSAHVNGTTTNGHTATHGATAPLSQQQQSAAAAAACSILNGEDCESCQ